MNTTDNQADQHQNDEADVFAGLGDAGAVDNDAYGKEPAAPAAQEHDDTDADDSDDDENQPEPKKSAEPAEDEEEEFYWDGAPLESPTGKEEDGEADDTPLIKQLRQTIKEQRTQLRDKNITPPAAATQAPAAVELPPYPKMEDEGIDWDPEIFAQKVREWHQTEAQVKQQQEQLQKSQQQMLATFDERKASYKQRVAKMKIRGYEDAEAFVAGELDNGVQTALILHADRPEMVVLALARNADLMKQAKEINDPVKLGVLIGTIQAKAKAMPVAKRDVKGAPANPRGTGASQLGDLESEIAKANKTGDYTRVIQLKKQRRAAEAKK